MTATAGSAIYGNTITATAAGGSGSGAVTWALGAGSTAANPSVTAGGVISVSSTGTVNVVATKAGDATYNAATASATATFTVRSLTVTLAGSKTYDGSVTPTGASASISAGSLASGDSINFSFTNTTSANVNGYSGLTISSIMNGADNRTANYSITNAGTYSITKANQLAVTSAGGSVSIGSTFTATPAGGSGTGAYSFALVAGGSSTGGAVSGAGVVSATSTGTVLFNLTRAGDGNYNASTASPTYTVTFTKVDQAALTATGGSVVYGDTVTATVAGGSGSGAVTWALGAGSTAANPSVTAGGVISATSTGTVNVVATKAGDSTYNAATANATATFTARPLTVTLGGSKFYDGLTTATGATASITAGSLAGTDTIAYSFGVTNSANAGVYPTTAITGSMSISNATAPTARTPSYSVTYNGTYTITKANQPAVTLAPSPSSIHTGESSVLTASGGAGTGTWSFTVAPVVALSGSGATRIFTTTIAGAYSFTAQKAADPNYNPSSTALASVTVLPPIITVTIAAPTSVYSGSPVNVSSTATAQYTTLSHHSIDIQAPDGTWMYNTAPASGTTSTRLITPTFASIGAYNLRAGASYDGGLTWTYSATVVVTVANGIVDMTVRTMALPNNGMDIWYKPSQVGEKAFRVQKKN